MDDGGPRTELLIVTAAFEIGGQMLAIDPVFALPIDGWQSFSTEATIKTPNGESFEWPLVLELSHLNQRSGSGPPGSTWRIVPCFHKLPKAAVPIDSRVLIDPEVVARLIG